MAFVPLRVLAQFLDRLGCRQHEQVDVAACGLLLHFIHDGQGPRKKAAARLAKPRRKSPPKADKFLARLPAKFTIDHVRKVAGKAAPISLAQWARSKKVKKVAGGYQKAA
jgi:hypothetical protein